MIKHTWNQLSERTTIKLEEQAPMPAAMPAMPGMPGMPGQAQESDEQKLFSLFKQNGQIDEFIQMMRMEGYNDTFILEKIKKKFYPEIVYWARKQILGAAAQQEKMQGQSSESEFDGGGGAGDIGDI